MIEIIGRYVNIPFSICVSNPLCHSQGLFSNPLLGMDDNATVRIQKALRT